MTDEHDVSMIADLMRIAQLQNDLRKVEREFCEKMERKCICGDTYEFHRGYDAACPNPLRNQVGQPLYFEDSRFKWSGEDIRRSMGISDFALSQHVTGGNYNA